MLHSAVNDLQGIMPLLSQIPTRSKRLAKADKKKKQNEKLYITYQFSQIHEFTEMQDLSGRKVSFFFLDNSKIKKEKIRIPAGLQHHIREFRKIPGTHESLHKSEKSQ